ncbi:hypothetical protein EHO61_00845 [Leptospira fluminis]|uniref:DUF4468 domain-containing protein n=1 Tax=Leptospira fluminis TaxID=2484979 RepID=A0A4R9GTY2_9LEPT|nr:hypothetical protein [Leptospira fluminis]TGK22361.1 hypothetical protein EHO61_00845 [Leptospira fluminis]
MKKATSSAILFFVLTVSTYAQDIEPDGQIKILPYKDTQIRALEALNSDIKYFHKRIEELLSFLNKRKKIQNNEYVQFIPAIETYELPNRERFLFDKKFFLKVSGQGPFKLEGIRFVTRKSMVTKLRPVNDELGILKNENVSAPEANSIVLSVQRKTDGGIQEETYNLSNIRNPDQRVKLVRSYRNNLVEVIQAITKYVEGTIQADRRDVETMLDGLDQGGSFQEESNK